MKYKIRGERMIRVRYPEKKYLSTYDLSLDFFYELGLEVLDVTPLRKVFILHTDEGKKILKKMDLSKERIDFINICLKNIYKEFPYVISFRTFEDGNVYKKWKGDYYLIMDLIEGREVTFTNPIEYEMSGRLLGEMHLASQAGLVKIEEELNCNAKELMEESLVKKFSDSLEDIKYIKKLVKSYRFKNEFDKEFLKVVDDYIKEIERAAELLSFSVYSSYRENSKNIVVCHNDLAEHNFLIKDDDMYLIDFDYCSIDLRIMDLTDLILKGIKNAAFDVDKAVNIIEAYNEVCPLEKEEYKFIYILLSYPRDFYSIVRDYYHKQKDWDEEVFISRLNNKLMNEEFRHEFLVKYKEKYKELFY